MNKRILSVAFLLALFLGLGILVKARMDVFGPKPQTEPRQTPPRQQTSSPAAS